MSDESNTITIAQIEYQWRLNVVDDHFVIIVPDAEYCEAFDGIRLDFASIDQIIVALKKTKAIAKERGFL